MSNVSAKKVYIQIETPTEQQVSVKLASLAIATTKAALCDQENIKNQRRTFKVLQGVATDKENLAGRTYIDKLTRLKNLTENTLASTPELAKRKKIETRPVETQTTPSKDVEPDSSNNKVGISVADLTNEKAEPSVHYWERLAEKRGEALEETLKENQRLHEHVEELMEELNTSRQMLEEANNLIEVLKEILKENEEKNEDSDDATSKTDDPADDEEEVNALKLEKTHEN